MSEESRLGSIYGEEQLRTREHRSGELEHIEPLVVEGLRSTTLDGILSIRDDSRQRPLQIDRGDARPRMEEFFSAAGDSIGRVVRKHRGKIGDCCVSIDHNAKKVA